MTSKKLTKAGEPINMFKFKMAFFGNLILLTLLLLCLPRIEVASAASSSSSLMPRSNPPIEIDAVREQYLSLEQSLWQHLNRSQNIRNTEQQMRKIIDSHRLFVNEHMNSSWSAGKYEILNHYEWSILERDLQQIETLFGAFKRILNSQENSVELTRTHELEDLMENILRNDRTFSMGRIFQDIELIMVKQTMYYRAMMVS